MNAKKSPYRADCPECGREIQWESATMLGADYWQHMSGEHGMNRSISVQHIRTI